jgi:hypothetical protein
MKFDPVFLLLVLAFFILVIVLVYSEYNTIPMRFRNPKRRKVLLGQLSIVVLLLATALTVAWPSREIDSLMQGAILSSLVIVPAFIFNLLVSLHYNSAYSDEAITTEAGTQAWFATSSDFYSDDLVDGKLSPKRISSPEETGPNLFPNEPIDFGTDNMPVIEISADSKWPVDIDFNGDINLEDLQDEFAYPPKRIAYAATSTGIPKPYSDTEDEKENESLVEGQLGRVSEFVQSHDLDIENTVSLDTSAEPDSPSEVTKSVFPQFHGMSSLDADPSELESMTTGEMSGLVVSLRQDNGRLQKLVIAQHAVIESGKESHNRSRDVARDAIKLMEDAQSNQRLAEKVARREKSERKHIQSEFVKVTSALENAMSIIAGNKEKSASAETA